MPISVIVPTFRSPDALDLCLRSLVEGQTEINEIIVVVDGHYDVNKDVIAKYNHTNGVYYLILDENQGLCRATNLGVYNAKNTKVLIINDDNVAPKNWDYLLNLNLPHLKDSVIAPNQIEPIPSMFRQFIIEDLGRDPKTFNLEKFWEFTKEFEEENRLDSTGSTLPIFISKINYLKVGGWDENYEQGMVSDCDFFLKCRLNGLKMLRTYDCPFYHFVSLSVPTKEQRIIRNEQEIQGHEYAKYKWGNYIQHNPETNLKTI